MSEQSSVLTRDNMEHEQLLAVYLAIHLQHGDNHSLSAYFNTLPSPQETNSFPLFWDLDDVSTMALARSYAPDKQSMDALLREVRFLQSSANEDYRKITELYDISGQRVPFTIQQYKHAWVLVNSRNFNSSDAVWVWGSECVLLPFADLLNHAGPGPQGEGLQWIWNPSRGTMDFMSIRTIAADQELLINYSGTDSGLHPLDQIPAYHFLVYYGFLETKTALRSKL